MKSTPTLNHEIPELTVSEVSKIIKTILEGSLSSQRIRGEISGLKKYDSGHIYFNLKDDTALLKAVCWRGAAGKIEATLADGLLVVCEGDLTTYPAQSTYQLNVRHVEPAGEGALLKVLEERKQKLQREGFFNKERKSLPRFPSVIGIITSPTGAVIQDMLSRLQERFPVHVILWPVVVQGENTVRQVVQAIEGFNAEKIGALSLKPDIVIIARGGGSIEDLWSFNDEAVVRAVFHSSIPVISAIGHETDTTLIDYASDVRAPTPTAAAEIAVPDRAADLIRQLADSKERLVRSLGRLEIYNTQRLEDKKTRLDAGIKSTMGRLSTTFDHLKERLRHPRDLIIMKHMQLDPLILRLHQVMTRFMERTESRFESFASLLNSYSHAKTLERGFCMVQRDNNVIMRGKDLKEGNKVDLVFYDGEKNAVITSKSLNNKKKIAPPINQERFDF